MANGQDVRIITFNAGGYSATNKRYDFTDEAKSISKSSGEDLCHYISFEYIKKALVTAANKFYRGEHNKEQFLQNIRLLCEAVKTGERKVNTSAMNAVYTNIDMAVEALESVSNNTQDMSDTLNTLLYNLNSADTNLRSGNRSWNRSIGGEYDPESWVYCGADKQIEYTNLDPGSEDMDVVKALIQSRDNVNCFYLVNYIDCKKYGLLCALDGIEPPSIFGAKHRSGEKLLYSSNNFIFKFDKVRKNYKEDTASVYYFPYD